MKRDGEGDAMHQDCRDVDMEGLQRSTEKRVEGILAGPPEAETCERDTDLRHREQAARIGEQVKCDLGARLALFGELTKPGLAHGDKRNLGGGEEAVHSQN